MSDLTARDIAWLARSYITPELQRQAGIFRVDSTGGAELVGKNGGGELRGSGLP